MSEADQATGVTAGLPGTPPRVIDAGTRSPASRSVRSRFGGIVRQPEFLAATALACLYFAVMSGHSYSIDGLLMYRQAVSIVYDHSLRFSDPIWWGQAFSTSKYGIGLSLLYVPGIAAASWFVSPPVPPPGIYDWALFYRDPVYMLGAAPVHVLVGAAGAYLVARLVRELGYGSGTAIVALVGYGIASPAIAYARGDFSQPLLGLCLTAGILAGVRFRRSGGWAPLIWTAFSLLYAVLTRPVEGTFLLPALLLLVNERRLPNRPKWRYGPNAVIAGSYLLALGITGLINWLRTGTPLATGYGGGWTTPLWVGLPGLLFSPARGILFEFPFVVLAPLGLRRLWEKDQRMVAVALLTVTGALLFNNVFWSSWWGSWSWGARLLVPALPLLAVPAAIGAASLRPTLRVWLPAILLLAGALWALPGTVTDLLAGYAGTYDSGLRSFELSSYPPIGAWAFVHHVRALSPFDNTGVDIVWFRFARRSGNLSIAVPLLLTALAGVVWLRAGMLVFRPEDEPLSIRRSAETSTRRS